MNINDDFMNGLNEVWNEYISKRVFVDDAVAQLLMFTANQLEWIIRKHNLDFDDMKPKMVERLSEMMDHMRKCGDV